MTYYVSSGTLNLTKPNQTKPVKIVPDMTYNVFGGTLNLALSIWHLTF